MSTASAAWYVVGIRDLEMHGWILLTSYVYRSVEDRLTMAGSLSGEMRRSRCVWRVKNGG